MNQNRLFVGNLSYQTMDRDLQDFFSPAGVVTSATLMLDKFTGKSRGFAFVEFSTAEEANKAVEMFHALNPINHTRSRDDVDHYKAEPYVVAGDVYARPPHAGRAGWSWYTGSAAWMYRVGLESILGLRRSGNTFTIDPCIPASWPGYEMRWRVQGTEYRISVENPARLCRGVARVVVDGVEEHTRIVPLRRNAGTCHVRVVLGPPSG